MIRNEIPKNIPPICISEFINEARSACPTVEGMILILDSIKLWSKFKIDP